MTIRTIQVGGLNFSKCMAPCRSRIHGTFKCHWIGLRENLQETMVFTIKYLLYGCVTENVVKTPIIPMVLLIMKSLWKMAISLGIFTQHFQTNPNVYTSFDLLETFQSFAHHQGRFVTLEDS